jgi:WD40 repeat protein
MTSVGIAQDFTLQPVRTFSGHEYGVKKVVFAPDGKTFASGGTRGEVIVWNVETGTVKQRFTGITALLPICATPMMESSLLQQPTMVM